eukprot:Platyproteum_vivax@DN2491_c0_g1_i1.p1
MDDPEIKPGGNRLADVQRQLDNSMVMMRDNVTKMTERGEQVETLLEKSDNLNQASETFNQNSRELERQMQWQYYRNIVIALVVLISVVVVFFFNRTAGCILLVFAIIASLGAYYFYRRNGDTSNLMRAAEMTTVSTVV